MLFLVIVLIPLLLSPTALAQSSSSSVTAAAPSSSGAANSTQDLEQIYNALLQANYTGLLNFAASLPNTTEGQAVLDELVTGNKTLLVPSNEAFANLSQNITNMTLVAQTVAYHILNNTYTANGTRVAPNHSIARTILRDSEFSLPGNFSAPVVLARNASNATNFEIVQFNANTTTNVSAQGPTQIANVLVYVIDQVLGLPVSIDQFASEAYSPTLAGEIQDSGILSAIAASPGVTVFAPTSGAFDNGPDFGSNITLVTEDFANHIINGSVAYSTNFATGNYTSAGGQPFKFASNSSGTYVTVGNSTAKIVQSDIIISNGVVHLIDSVLVDTESHPAAAASAFSSGIAAAQTSTEPTSPVTATTAPAASGSAPSSTVSKSAGQRVATAPWGLAMSGALAGTVVLIQSACYLK
ncbi:hypothetical protein JCM24511_07379 [Saitozyma sp. JCM 24511]|nr:hypothetical protein JCM24511_07379 [Saitozyma sp. JCM 24511]